jgi:hypothetical protein
MSRPAIENYSMYDFHIMCIVHLYGALSFKKKYVSVQRAPEMTQA